MEVTCIKNGFEVLQMCLRRDLESEKYIALTFQVLLPFEKLVFSCVVVGLIPTVGRSLRIPNATCSAILQGPDSRQSLLGSSLEHSFSTLCFGLKIQSLSN